MSNRLTFVEAVDWLTRHIDAENCDLDDVLSRCCDADATGYQLRPWVTPQSVAQVALQYPPPLGREANTTNLPCPNWCTRPTGHPFETNDPDDPDLPDPDMSRLFRVHRHRLSDKPVHVAVETVERAASATGPSDLGTDTAATAVRVRAPPGRSWVHLTPAGAGVVALANCLVRATRATVAPGLGGSPLARLIPLSTGPWIGSRGGSTCSEIWAVRPPTASK